MQNTQTLKNLTDQISLINEKLNNLNSNNEENQFHFNDELKNLKSKIDKDSVSNEDLMLKISTVDKIYKNMESDFDKTKLMNEQIRNNLEQTEEIISSIKEEVKFFETKTMRSNERNSKTLVQIKVSLESIVNEFA